MFPFKEPNPSRLLPVYRSYSEKKWRVFSLNGKIRLLFCLVEWVEIPLSKIGDVIRVDRFR